MRIWMTIFISHFISAVIFAQRLNPATRIKLAPDTTAHILLSGNDKIYNHTELRPYLEGIGVEFTPISLGIYDNDEHAASGGVPINSDYYLSQTNTLGGIPGSRKKRIN